MTSAATDVRERMTTYKLAAFFASAAVVGLGTWASLEPSARGWVSVLVASAYWSVFMASWKTPEPWTRGAYSYQWDGDFLQVLDALVRPVDDRLFWAGSGVSATRTATVHGAMETAYDAVVERNVST